jgi:hypothetical protein
MNCTPPEVAALHIWPQPTPGAVVLPDDYTYFGADEQRLAMDALAGELDVCIWACPQATAYSSSQHAEAARTRSAN